VPTRHPASRVLNGVLILAGVVATALLAAVVVEVVVGTQLRFLLGRRRMEKELSSLKEHYIVCGYGRMGQELVEQFQHRGAAVVVIDTSEAKCRMLAELSVRHVHGDAANDEVLLSAGIQRARGLITVAPRDADNIFITLSARALNSEITIVARSVYDEDVHKLELAGADRVISPYVIGAQRIAAAMFEPTVVEFLDVQNNQGSVQWQLTEVAIGEGNRLSGCSLRHSEIREKSGCTVLAIRRSAEADFHSNPVPDTVLRTGDTLVVIGTEEQVRRLHHLAGLRPGGVFGLLRRSRERRAAVRAGRSSRGHRRGV